MIELVKAVQDDDGDWFVIPNELLTSFNKLLEKIYVYQDDDDIIDDAFMNLWMKKQSEDSMWYYIRHFETIPMLHSCEFEYEVFIRRFPDIISNKEVVEISFN